MTKFHDFDPLAMLLECQRLAQTAFNNTQELARSHNQLNNHMVDLVNQHNQVVDLLKTARREIELLKHEIEYMKQQNNKEKS